MKKCAEAGCNAKVMTNLYCEHHRVRDHYHKPPSEEERAKKNEQNRQAKARRRATAGTLPGWVY